MTYNKNRKAVKSSTPGEAPNPVPQAAAGVGTATNVDVTKGVGKQKVGSNKKQLKAQTRGTARY